MKILITGTHFTPAQSVIEEFQDFEDSEIVYVGRKTTQEGDKAVSLESQILPKMGIKFIPVISGRIRRVFDFYTILSFLKIPIGFFQAFYIILKEQPDVILSFGGYVGVPVVFWGWWFSIPIIVHEQTLVSGLANSVSNLFADKIAVSFDLDYSFNKEKVIVTGNPIRSDVLEEPKDSDGELDKFIKKAQSEKMPIIFVTGGNQGSDVINKTVFEILDNITQKAYLIHQTGDSKAQWFNQLKQKKSEIKNSHRYLVRKYFIGEFGLVLRNIDLAVSRAGINTLIELSLFGIPAIVVPLPYLFRDEQNKNARFFEQSGLCQILSQSKLNAENLEVMLTESLKNLKKLKEDASKAKKVVIQDASKKLVLQTMILVQKVKYCFD